MGTYPAGTVEHRLPINRLVHAASFVLGTQFGRKITPPKRPRVAFKGQPPSFPYAEAYYWGIPWKEKAMPCDCEVDGRKTYHAAIQLWSERREGIPAGSAILLEPVEVTVCTQCGKSEFIISQADMQRRFGRAKPAAS